MSAHPPKVFTSVVSIDDTSSKAETPTFGDINHPISKRGTTIATQDGGTLHVQPFRRTGSKQLRALVTFVPRPSHFDSSEAGADQFRGFYSLFWIFCALLSVKTIVLHHKETGSLLSWNFGRLISKDLFALLLSEAALTFTSLWAVLLVKAFKRGYIRYYWTGVIVQHVYQSAMLALAIGWTFSMRWEWVQSGYFTLRCLVLIMKIHSYIAFNGYLQGVDAKTKKIEQKLRMRTNEAGGWDQAVNDALARREELEQQETTPSETPALMKAGGYFNQPPAATALRNRLHNLEVPKELKLKRKGSSNSVHSETSSIQPLSVAIPPAGPTPHPLVDHPDKSISTLAKELSELEAELTSNGPKQVRWPANITWLNYIDYQMLPTLVYELEYPRTDRVRPMYVLEKTIATFGTFFLLYQYTEHFIMPHIPEAGQSFVYSMLNLALPFMVCYLILFYLIFECICNGFAELSCFADREFYEDWWNSTSWDQFARKWNKPVHTFLLRHVYASTLSYKIGKGNAALLTFFLSACVHELVMAVVTKKIRPYLFVLQMSQIPLIALGRVPFIKRNKLLGNVVFWIGLMAGQLLK
ncbi:Probable sterol O-acyltransferase 1; AltName: Full=Sterol-ester synthase 1 [Serendipita indica DSM 11827]|uniref:O-acyltransferase n=1 Tax=Serendipita indica (strain DSM 11827) TaxID=1109443 RepID=G4TKM4_SERID|nr:Probable sterol O-acyltransferase 1; AltName: Full=Sterol-ester synthase 1 [Serendipita indica DSM 11827]CCA71867.1 related to acyl-CoA sterol acyltransferase [Serendipita indica DSM 11827]